MSYSGFPAKVFEQDKNTVSDSGSGKSSSLPCLNIEQCEGSWFIIPMESNKKGKGSSLVIMVGSWMVTSDLHTSQSMTKSIPLVNEGAEV